ncbi:nucleotidyl transferase AbiEii/AbiGii toxin family protein, partial [bacterium]|nr:nucleotidyl transferase AbiEii/AbiGii toxin family protein [bacterium]
MKEVLQDKISKYKTNSEKYNYLREYLQLLILKIIEEKGYFQNIAFVGGTAVRILYDLPRFSEDLDFSSIKKLNFKDFLTNIKKELELYGFEIEITFKETKTVKNSFIKFKNILQELNITNQIDQKLSIKIEIDSNPPKG